MEGEVIKSFLVGLGFGVDDASLSKFNKSIASATLKVTALYGAINTASSAIVYGISKISQSFEDLGYQYRLIVPAINKAIILRRELFKAYSAAGINLQKTVIAAYNLNMSLTKTKFALEAIYKSVGARFFGLLTKQSDLFRAKIYQNMPKIQATLEKLIQFIFKSLEAVTALGLRLWSILGRVYDFFVLLDEKTDGWSTRILGVIAAWKLLNLEFLATPLGMIIAGLVAILALFDDFETWKEGGKSLFNWAPFVPVINAVANSLSRVWDVLVAIGTTLGDVAAAFYLLFKGNGAAAWDAFKEAGQGVLTLFKNLWELVKSQLNVFGAIGDWASGIITKWTGANLPLGPNTSVPNNFAIPQVAPIGGNTAFHNQTNQNLNQQTNITIQGVSDPNAAAAAAGSEQTKVNYDLSRNMRPKTR